MAFMFKSSSLSILKVKWLREAKGVEGNKGYTLYPCLHYPCLDTFSLCH